MVVKNEANRVAWFGNGYGGKYHLMTNGMTGNTTDYTATLVTIFVQKDGFNSYRVICPTYLDTYGRYKFQDQFGSGTYGSFRHCLVLYAYVSSISWTATVSTKVYAIPLW